ncbi:unnamed protein product [Parajaminaea phylloscopi]
MAGPPSLSPRGASPLPDLVRSGSEDGGSSVSTLSSSEGHFVPLTGVGPFHGDAAMRKGHSPHRSTRDRLIVPPIVTAPLDEYEASTASHSDSSASDTQPSRPFRHATSHKGASNGDGDGGDAYSARRANLVDLHQAANYATLSQPTAFPEPTLPDEFADLTMASNIRRPTMPRMSSTLTARPTPKSSLSPASSSAATPAAVIVEDPMEKASVVEQLEKKVESPSCSSSSGGWNTDSDPASFSPVVPSDLSSVTYSTTAPLGRPSDIARAAGVASPDSWRSLLPEDDPYYASEALLAERLRRDRHSASRLDTEHIRPPLARDDSRESTTSQGASSNAAWSTSSRRLSSSSMASIQSTLSLPTPSLHKSPAQARHSACESWRSLLPEGDPAGQMPEDDDSAHSASDSHPAVFEPESRTRHLGSLTRSKGTIRSSIQREVREPSPTRRHASFSSFERADQPLSTGYATDTGRSTATAGHNVAKSPPPAPSAHLSSRIKTNEEKRLLSGRSTAMQHHSWSEGAAEADAKRDRAHNFLVEYCRSSLPAMPPQQNVSHAADWSSAPRTTSRAAMEDAEERERWPSSRVSRDALFMQRALSECPELRHSQSADQMGNTQASPSSAIRPAEGVSGPCKGSQVTSTPPDARPPSRVNRSRADHVRNIDTTSISNAVASRGASGRQGPATTTQPETANAALKGQNASPLLPGDAGSRPNTRGSDSSRDVTAPHRVDAGRPYVMSFDTRTHTPATVRVEPPEIKIDSIPTRYTITVSLPRFAMQDIVIASTATHVLSITARQPEYRHKWRIRFPSSDTTSDSGPVCDPTFAAVRAEFDGTWLVVKVPRTVQRDSPALMRPSVSPLSSESSSSSTRTAMAADSSIGARDIDITPISSASGPTRLLPSAPLT